MTSTIEKIYQIQAMIEDEKIYDPFQVHFMRLVIIQEKLFDELTPEQVPAVSHNLITRNYEVKPFDRVKVLREFADQYATSWNPENKDLYD